MQLEQRNRPPKHSQTELYEPEFVTSLFDEMSATYGITNYWSGSDKVDGCFGMIRPLEFDSSGVRSQWG
jgi:hypothetical protein